MSGIGRGVVVTTWRGRGPSRRPNCSMSQVSSRMAPLAELVAPGGVELRPAQAVGSSAEKAWATAPFGQTRRLRDGLQRGRSAGGEQARMPGGPRP